MREDVDFVCICCLMKRCAQVFRGTIRPGWEGPRHPQQRPGIKSLAPTTATRRAAATRPEWRSLSTKTGGQGYRHTSSSIGRQERVSQEDLRQGQVKSPRPEGKGSGTTRPGIKSLAQIKISKISIRFLHCHCRVKSAS